MQPIKNKIKYQIVHGLPVKSSYHTHIVPTNTHKNTPFIGILWSKRDPIQIQTRFILREKKIQLKMY